MEVKSREGASHITPADIERVMEVAGRLFAEHGYEGVGIRLIATESGVKMPSIFYHFDSKAALYDEVLEYQYNATTERVSQAIKALHDPREKLECIIGSYFDLLLRDRTFLPLVHRNIVDVVAHKNRPAFMEEYSYVFSMFCTLLQAAFDRPVEKRIAFSLVSLILGFCELTAVSRESNSSMQEQEAWYARQRADLIEVGTRICLM